MSRQQITQEHQYHGHLLQWHETGLIQNILDGFHARVNYMKTQYSQVVAAHFIVTWPDDVPFADANTVIGESINSLRKTFANRGIFSHYGWVREVAESRVDNKPHYHIWFLLNGHDIQSGWGIAMHLNALFCRRIGKDGSSRYVHCAPPAPNLDQQAEYNLRNSSALKLRVNAPNADAQTSNLIHWLSYAAKKLTKGNVPPRIREFGFSRL